VTYTGTLTPAHLALIEETITDRMTNALSTQRCDRTKAEAAVNELYRLAGRTPPSAFIWMDSPLGGVYALTVLKLITAKDDKSQLGGQLRGQLGDQLRDQLGDQLWSQLGGQLWSQLWGQLRGQLRDQLGCQLGDQLGGQLRGQLGDQLRDQLGDQLWSQLGGQLWSQLWGQLRGQLRDQLGGQLGDQLGDQGWQFISTGFNTWYETYWTAFYSDGLAIAGLPESAQLKAFTTVLDHTGWWYATPEVAFMTERPTVISRDAQGRLHNAHGAALEYADGYGFNAWHGTRLPDDFHTRDWNLEAVMTETNTEVRRCAIEATGWDRFIAESNMQPVGRPVPDPGNAPHTLTLYDLPKALDGLYRERARVLLCTNGTVERDGTRHRYGLIVPAHHKDPLAAAADLYGMTRDQYAGLEVRR
jgi:hypothetical protein